MNFEYTLPQSSAQLSCSLILLKDWKLIKVTGTNALQYLQTQLTCDLNTINTNQYTFGAHCNYKGKIISNMYVLYLNSKEIALIEKNNICSKQIAEMKKYAIFSKITISIEDNVELYGVAGLYARTQLKKIIKILPNTKTTMVHKNKIVILHLKFPQERFLVIITNEEKEIIKKLKKNMEISNSTQWTALDIEAGYPIINIENSEKITPQSANLHLLNAISFNKGCYMGQEVLARIKYKHTNKKALYWLIGRHNKHISLTGSNLEIKINQHWKSTGLILESCILNTGTIWIQAVLSKFISKNTPLRTIDGKIQLKISDLPYQITT